MFAISRSELWRKAEVCAVLYGLMTRKQNSLFNNRSLKGRGEELVHGDRTGIWLWLIGNTCKQRSVDPVLTWSQRRRLLTLTTWYLLSVLSLYFYKDNTRFVLAIFWFHNWGLKKLFQESGTVLWSTEIIKLLSHTGDLLKLLVTFYSFVTLIRI